MLGIVELGKRSIGSFFEHRMMTYAEQLFYQGLFGFFPFILLAAVLSVVYRFVPDTDRSFRFATPGAVFAVIAWAITSLGFSFFLANFAGHSLT